MPAADFWGIVSVLCKIHVKEKKQTIKSRLKSGRKGSRWKLSVIYMLQIRNCEDTEQLCELKKYATLYFGGFASWLVSYQSFLSFS